MCGWYEPVTALATGTTVVAAMAIRSKARDHHHRGLEAHHRHDLTAGATDQLQQAELAPALADREHEGVEHCERAEDDHQTEQYVADPRLCLGVGVLGRLHDLATTDVDARVIGLESSQRRSCRTASPPSSTSTSETMVSVR